MQKFFTILGSILVGVGLIALIDNILHIHIWMYLGPILLIAFGVWILIKPADRPWWTWILPVGWNPPAEGEWRNTGNHHEHHVFAGHTVLDLAHEDIPAEGANYHMHGFAGEVEVRVPADLGVKVHASYFAGTINFFGEEMTGVMAPVGDETPGFDLAPRKVYIDVQYFAGETNVISKG